MIRVIRWVARIWTCVAIGLVAISMIAERTHPVRPQEWLGFVFFPAGVSVGMALGWRREWLGGAVAVASLGVFYAIHRATAGVFPSGPAWLAFAAPGFLFLLCAWGSRAKSRCDTVNRSS